MTTEDLLNKLTDKQKTDIQHAMKNYRLNTDQDNYILSQSCFIAGWFEGRDSMYAEACDANGVSYE